MNFPTSTQFDIFPTDPTYLLLPGEQGQLELLITPLNSTQERPKIAVICHPHPLYGGTMHNKVVTTVAKSLQKLGLSTVLFNYRGVGKSAGEYGGGEGEVQDLRTILQWLDQVLPGYELWLAGFSFGAYISFRMAAERGCQQLISIAPAIHHQDYQPYLPLDLPWLIIQGEADEIVPAELVKTWALNLKPKPDLIMLPETSHFFHGKLTILCDLLIQNLLHE